MALITAVVPVPVAVGVGAAVSTLTMGAKKTLVIDGVFVAGATLTVEVSNGVGGFTALESFSAPAVVVIPVVCNEMRCRVEGAALGAAVTCDVISTDNGAAVLALNVPAADGVSVGVDISAMGPFLTAICVSALPFAGTLTIELSADDVHYGSGMESFVETDVVSREIPAMFARVRRQGFNAAVPGSPPTIELAGELDCCDEEPIG